MNRRVNYILQALGAAALFGISAPLAKLFVADIHPVVFSSLLYLGCGIGLFLFRLGHRKFSKSISKESKLDGADIKWLIGAIVAGGVAAPIVLLYSLKLTTGATASLLLNFESVSTTVIAAMIFRESVAKQVWAAVIIITIGSALLTVENFNALKISVGSAGVLAACMLWGLDNNLTRNISGKDAVVITTIKGIAAGSISLVIALASRFAFPEVKYIIAAMIIGFVCYGASIVLFINSLRHLGSSRTGAYFSLAPFIGAIVSFIILKENPGMFLFIALPIMILGAGLLSFERHSHSHIHEEFEHDHLHSHDDGHHNHTHDFPGFTPSLVHSHPHKHEYMEHTHEHTPDLHHRHSH